MIELESLFSVRLEYIWAQHLRISNFCDSSQNNEDQTMIHDCHCNEYHTNQDISCQSTESCYLILDKYSQLGD